MNEEARETVETLIMEALNAGALLGATYQEFLALGVNVMINCLRPMVTNVTEDFARDQTERPNTDPNADIFYDFIEATLRLVVACPDVDVDPEMATAAKSVLEAVDAHRIKVN